MNKYELTKNTYNHNFISEESIIIKLKEAKNQLDKVELDNIKIYEDN